MSSTLLDIGADLMDVETCSTTSTSYRNILFLMRDTSLLQRGQQLLPNHRNTLVSFIDWRRKGSCALFQAHSSAASIDTCWLSLHRIDVSEPELQRIAFCLSVSMRDNGKLLVFGMDALYTNQIAAERVVRIRDGKVHTLDWTCSVPLLNRRSVEKCFTEHGFQPVKLSWGDDMVKSLNVNMTPQELWNSQPFFVLEMTRKPRLSLFVS